MFVETQDINAMEPRGEPVEANRGGRGRPAHLRVVRDVEREREAEATILRLLLSERPAELRACAVIGRIGDRRRADRAIDALVEDGLLIRVDEYVLATVAAVRLQRGGGRMPR